MGRPDFRCPLQPEPGSGSWRGTRANPHHPRGSGVGCFGAIAYVSEEGFVEGRSLRSSSCSGNCATAGRDRSLLTV